MSSRDKLIDCTSRGNELRAKCHLLNLNRQGGWSLLLEQQDVYWLGIAADRGDIKRCFAGMM